MAVITLTSDWKKNDYYLGALKGYFLSNCPDISVIDISHDIPGFNISQAAFIIRNCYKHYPEGTIHIICVSSETKSETPFLIVEFYNQYFIGADNGIFSLIFPDGDIKIYSIPFNPQETTFPEKDIFAVAAVKLVQGKKPEEIGKQVNQYNKQVQLRAAIDESAINGSIIYIDSYQNAITNITSELFNRVGKGREFEIVIQSNYYKISKINKQYNETSSGELLALFNSAGLLEIAINSGNLAELMSINTGASVRIKFKDKK